MTNRSGPLRKRGFTLIELLAALLILSILALMSYRGLGAVLDARKHVTSETQKWRRLTAFFARFERDVQLAAPRAVRLASASAPAWIGRPQTSSEPSLEFSSFAAAEGTAPMRRLGYRLNDRQEIELWLWPVLDRPADTVATVYPVLTGVSLLQLQYLDPDLAWVDAWPPTVVDAPIPLAVRLRVGLVTGEEIIRVFALKL